MYARMLMLLAAFERVNQAQRHAAVGLRPRAGQKRAEGCLNCRSISRMADSRRLAQDRLC
jgi:hypothetical protein